MTHKEERNMTGKVITNTYKGILRISNNIDLIKGEQDSFLNNTYYLPTGAAIDWSGNGIQSTHNFLSENGQTTRFKSNDNYLNLKIPVTDSVGNYLNFSLGTESSLVGSPIKPASNKYFESDNSILVSVAATILGRSKQPEKKIIGANLNIESSDNFNSKLIVLNKKRHNGESLDKITDSVKVRTVYNITKTKADSQKYDALLYEQENYENSKDFKDCKVVLKNLKDYVDEQINRYREASESSVPAGTIISQYCSLDNSQGSNLELINTIRATKTVDTSYSCCNTFQNKTLEPTPYLYFNSNGRLLKEFNSKILADFKGAYALCNGAPMTISLRPFWNQFAKREKKSLELLDLFHMIGYYYHKNNKNLEIHRCILNPQTGIYSYLENINYQYTDCKIDNDVCYGITMATILAFKELNDKFSLEKEPFEGKTDESKLKKCLNWLSNRLIPEEYIFNTISPTELELELPNSYYIYENSQKNYINIGRQISSFNDEIPYYSYNNSVGQYNLTKCKIINMAEIRDIAMLFINKKINQDNWYRYSYTFYLPKLITVSTDISGDSTGENKIMPLIKL